jgi:hypothetical protein|tara:strand:- start:79 stop:525 length:447 start_codon:yes stop_codon:yes gene_type:complete
MDKYNILIGILLLLIIFDNKMVEGLTMDICDKNENKFKLLNEKINNMGNSNGKDIVINNNLCDEERTIYEKKEDDDKDDDEDEDDLYKKIFFNYIPKILIGILVSILLYFVVDFIISKKNKVTAMTYEEALENVKNAKVLKSKGIKLK